jgi:glycosyltransferase involved in cell wall biosynthesis
MMHKPIFDDVAVLIPCYNEEATVATVIKDFQKALPEVKVYVFDNNSSDRTIEVARSAGAIVREVQYQGKGSVVRRMFADVEADIYVLVDGDDTYNSAQAPEFIAKLAADGLDMVVGMRETEEHAAYRTGHRLGNVLLTKCVAVIFGKVFKDMLSGYRVFSRRYVKSFPAHSMGFEIETELTVHALELRMPAVEVPTVYKSRPEGSVSKLNTYRDGIRILRMILSLFKAEKPLAAFSIGFLVCALISIVLAIPLFETYLRTGLVPRLPTALLCAAVMLFGAMLLVCGIILDTVTRGRTEAKRFAYLTVSGPRNTAAKTDTIRTPCSRAN